ncbi:MAG: TonB family protein [Bacteroidetes bacterium]|nr:MAG: TonB family protein [Bacteroidota bacterium]
MTRIILLLLACLPLSWTHAQVEPDINEFVFVDQEPAPKNLAEVRAEMTYPQSAVDQGIEGTVIARILVDTEGKYVRHKIVNSPSPILSGSVTTALPKLSFTPATRGDTAIMYWVNIPFPFRLVDEREATIRKRITELTDQLTGDPENYELWHRRGIQRSQLGELEDALLDFDESLRLNPRKNKKKAKKNTYPFLFFANFGKGASLTKLERYPEALAYYSEALRVAAEMKISDSAVTASMPSVLLERGYVLGLQESYDSARADLELALTYAGADTCTLYELLRDVGLAQDTASELVKAYDGLIACNPDDQLLYFSRGYYKAMSGDYAGAVTDLDQVSQESTALPLRLAAYNRSAWCHLQLNDLDGARARIDGALKLNVLNHMSYYYRARVLEAEGDQEGACADMKRAMTYGLEDDEREEQAEALAYLQAHCGWEAEAENED